MSVYAEHAPGAAVQTHVACYWSSRPGGVSSTAPHRVLPDGCLDLIVELDRGEASVVGAMTRALVVPPRGGSILAVRFRPGAAGALLGVPASELTDRRVPIDDVWPGARPLGDEVASARDLARAVAALERRLAARASAMPAPPADLRRAVRCLAASDGAESIAAVAAALGVTRQHLARRFAAHVGTAPKHLARVFRLHAAMRRAVSRPRWAAIAAELGYADQAHFIADFRSLAGVSPARWLAERHGAVPFLQDGGAGAA